jgi:WD repeat-containing protein 35
VLPDNSNTLVTIGERLENYGLCDYAVSAYLKANQVKKAVDCCILLNQWDKAVELAEKHNFFQIGNLLNRYANHLMESNKKIEAIELFRRANKNTESAKILCQIAHDMSQENVDWKIVKKI